MSGVKEKMGKNNVTPKDLVLCRNNWGDSN